LKPYIMMLTRGETAGDFKLVRLVRLVRDGVDDRTFDAFELARLLSRVPADLALDDIAVPGSHPREHGDDPHVVGVDDNPQNTGHRRRCPGERGRNLSDKRRDAVLFASTIAAPLTSVHVSGTVCVDEGEITDETQDFDAGEVARFLAQVPKGVSLDDIKMDWTPLQHATPSARTIGPRAQTLDARVARAINARSAKPPFNVKSMIDDTAEFWGNLVRLPVPDVPTRLQPARKSWTIKMLEEEATEFAQASTLEEEADALLDHAYFALGRLVEMGVHVGAAWADVQRANMAKVRDSEATKLVSKPPGWEPPDLTWLGHVSPAFAEAARLRAKKSDDYQAGGIDKMLYYPFGVESFVTEINKKSLRLVALTRKAAEAGELSARGGYPLNESFVDTVVDGINYLSYLWEFIVKGRTT